MADTYLDQVRKVVNELGILGGNAVTNITSSNFLTLTDPEYIDIKERIADADMFVQRMAIDWDYLWYDYSETMPAGSTSFPAISSSPAPEIKHWLQNTFWLNRTGSNPIELQWIGWKEWRKLYRSGSITTTQPGFVTQRPDGVIEIDVQSDQEYTAFAEGYRRPSKMVQHDDESLIPDEFRRIIELQAMIAWAGDKDATEILNLKIPQYEVVMTQLEGSELPSRAPNLMAENEDMQVEVL